MTENKWPLSRLVIAVLAAVLLSTVGLAASWALPGRVAQGQTIPLPTNTPTATRTALPTATATVDATTPELLETTVEEGAVGPGESVRVRLQFANTGLTDLTGVQVVGTVPEGLIVAGLECDGVTWSLDDAGGVIIDVGDLAAGSILSCVADVQVDDAAWPGQTLNVRWDLTADGGVEYSVYSVIELPWAELPAVGLLGERAP